MYITIIKAMKGNTIGSGCYYDGIAFKQRSVAASSEIITCEMPRVVKRRRV
ncbi:hypothetical protein [Clostridium estertheticum]|uniref:hypothetical protein n=1 Tax=Clostridium estertheticum TaxID=238834 RepID=UPI001C0C78F0|nr:hypothetical protein [Clostridium estertheticum]MBU3072403.1 hypothetical protein [Clostridium estertheticum]MBU3162496.1 hypothetical protein [Clostridium estertheticum]